MVHRRAVTGARSALGWGLLLFLVAQLTFDVVMDYGYPELHDPEYQVHLAALHARLSEGPDRPLMLLLGSSRTEMCFRPEALPSIRSVEGQPILPFNFSHLGGGPAMNVLTLTRLVRLGIRPRWLVVELLLPCLSNEGYSVPMSNAAAPDLALLARYAPPWKVYSIFARGRLVPWYKHRLLLLRRLMPDWVPADVLLEEDAVTINPLGGDHDWQLKEYVEPEKIHRLTEHARAGYYPALQRFHIKDRSARAVRDLLDLCRREQIQVVMLLAPEATEFRRWYAASAPTEIDHFLAELRQEYDVPVIDARDWLPDDRFIDTHHVILRGADEFTLRLGREVLQPLAEGRLPGTAPAERGR
jgi:hypothetical protein